MGIDRQYFTIKPSHLAEQLQINNSQLSKLVKSNSESTLYTDACLVCEKDIMFEITSQTSAAELLDRFKFECSECKSEYNTQNRDKPRREKKLHRLNYSLNFKFWNRLTKEEFEVLRKIIEFDNYYEFKRKYLNQNFDFAWEIIKKLDRLGLIDIRGENYDNLPISELYFLPELREALKIDHKENIYTETNLSFNIPRYFNKRKETQPDYLKRIIFNNDITLKQGVEYFCSVWENDNGSLNLSIREKSELPKPKIDQTQVNDQPKPLRDLIPKKWK